MQRDNPTFKIGSDFRNKIGGKTDLRLLFFIIILAVNLIIVRETFRMNLYRSFNNYNMHRNGIIMWLKGSFHLNIFHECRMYFFAKS